jgi:hypothetical protein
VCSEKCHKGAQEEANRNKVRSQQWSICMLNIIVRANISGLNKLNNCIDLLWTTVINLRFILCLMDERTWNCWLFFALRNAYNCWWIHWCRTVFTIYSKCFCSGMLIIPNHFTHTSPVIIQLPDVSVLQVT